MTLKYFFTFKVFKLEVRTGGFGCLQNRQRDKAARQNIRVVMRMWSVMERTSHTRGILSACLRSASLEILSGSKTVPSISSLFCSNLARTTSRAVKLTRKIFLFKEVCSHKLYQIILPDCHGQHHIVETVMQERVLDYRKERQNVEKYNQGCKRSVHPNPSPFNTPCQGVVWQGHGLKCSGLITKSMRMNAYHKVS